jgi:2-amino-4-hydroxy-6-hydroxymethyldihydropteridine diphosphokinase
VFLHLQAIEERLGRVKEVAEKWSARLIDLDLIAAESTVLSTPHLTIPHPEMQRREFVLGPMAEVVPQWRHPLLGKTVQELRSAL